MLWGGGNDAAALSNLIMRGACMVWLRLVDSLKL